MEGVVPTRPLRHGPQLCRSVGDGHSVVLVEHDMRLVARSDWVIDMGPGAGAEGGRIVAQGTPEAVSRAKGSRTASYLRRALGAREGKD